MYKTRHTNCIRMQNFKWWHVCLWVYYAVIFLSHLCVLTATKKLTWQTEYLVEAATQTDTCWMRRNKTTEWDTHTKQEHKSIDVSPAFPHLWDIIGFNKSLSIWPWFESTQSSKVISPTSPLDLCTGLQRKLCAFMCVRLICMCVCVCECVFYLVNSSRRLFGSEE